MAPMPPEDLRFNVAGTGDEKTFDELGRMSVRDFTTALSAVGKSFADFRFILEWGCGCGRILRHLDFDPDLQQVYGCDIDRKSIDWLKEFMPKIKAERNGEYPPLPYSDGQFDLIINHSVLSHLDEKHQDAWLTELRRVLAPHGVLILTVLGPSAHKTWMSTLPPARPDLDAVITASKTALKEKGIYFFVDNGWSFNFPSFYQSTFHTPQYVFEHWGDYFDISGYLPRRSLGHQDMIVLTHKSPPPPERLSSPRMDEEISALRSELAALRHSTSWRITSPMRALASILRRP
jgi:SAM-dependent methyltransferase